MMRWMVVVKGKSAEVMLIHQPWLGKRVIKLDGQVIVERREWFSRRWREWFMVLGERVELAGVIVGATQWHYFLLVDGKPVPSEGQKRAKVDREMLWKSAGIGHADYWQKLTQSSKLSYHPNPNGHFWFRHRLIGRLNNRLISVQLEQPFGSKVYLSLKAHFPPQEAFSTLKAKLLADERLPDLLGSKHNMGQKVGVAPAHIGIYLPYEPHLDSPEAVAEKIRLFANWVGEYSHPLPVNHCAECRQNKPVQWAWMNQFPVQICATCQQERLEWGQTAQEEMEQTSPRTWIGLLSGLLVGLWGAILWAIFTISVAGDIESGWPLLITLIAPLTVAVGIRLIYTLNRQPISWFWLAMTSFVTLGLVGVTVVAQVWEEVWVRQGLESAGIQNLTPFFLMALILTLAYGIRGWRNQQKQLAEMFTPQIEPL